MIRPVLAGAVIAAAGFGSIIATAATGAQFAAAIVFPIGIVLVTLLGAELFTGDCLLAERVWSGKANYRTLAGTMARAWVGNLIGAAAVALLAVASGLHGQIAEYAVQLAQSKCGTDFLEMLFRGIGCNFLVCMAVRLSSGKRAAGGMLAAYLPVALFVLCGFEHVVADMFYVPFGILCTPDWIGEGSLGWMELVSNMLVPVGIGNMMGGFLFAWMSYRTSFRK